ncbi:MAG: cyclodeaminase/cyclohydrolase family protein [Omnitrophica bacterium]|nr:cyclodeaminase/cyclohydrolase family protein [Candidatus Omnitrophota bacterium]
MYGETTINVYLNALASKSPVPGGGSVAALIGALASATLGKVVNFTLGKEKYLAHEEEMQGILKRLGGIRQDFNKLCSEDAKAYKKLSDAFKLPKDEKREGKIQAALKEAAMVPLEVCKKAHEAIKMYPPVARKGNSNLITDTEIAKLLFKCAFRSAVLNVEINLKSVKDEEFTRGIREALQVMRKDMDNIEEEKQ